MLVINASKQSSSVTGQIPDRSMQDMNDEDRVAFVMRFVYDMMYMRGSCSRSLPVKMMFVMVMIVICHARLQEIGRG